MRDFRDAKAMARALRDPLKAKTVEITHSECLELIAKAFGYENWNILAAKVEAARFGALDAAVVSTGGTIAAEANSTLHCSFCGKSQREVRKLIAGPTVFICDGCVGLCNDIIEDEKVFDFFAADDEDAALAGTSSMPAEELVSEVLRGKKYTERSRFGLAQVSECSRCETAKRPRRTTYLRHPPLPS